jgi:hypothetical protein
LRRSGDVIEAEFISTPDSRILDFSPIRLGAAKTAREWAKSRINRRLQFQKRGQLFIRSHNETLSVIAMCVCDPDRLPVGINRRDAAPTPTGFAEIVGE